jgi:hypothetical protein
MAKTCYDSSLKFKAPTLKLIAKCNEILEEYSKQGWHGITLRQLYYQLVSRDIIENNQKVYKALSVTISNARLAGLLDWDHIIDRARNLRGRSSWNHPSDILSACASQYHIDYWEGQEYRPEIWVEKEALIDVAERAGHQLDAPVFACKGFNSQSEMHSAALRFRRQSGLVQKRRQTPLLVYLGDHDPSGLDMSRDIDSRLTMFGAKLKIVRVALNYDQVEFYKPPPNPAKSTDSRYKDYRAQFGKNCWELDALEPNLLVKLITETIEEHIDFDILNEVKEREETARKVLHHVAERYDEIERKFLDTY